MFPISCILCQKTSIISTEKQGTERKGRAIGIDLLNAIICILASRVTQKG